MNALKELIRDVKAGMGIYESPDPEFHGLLAEYANPGALYHAAEGVRDAGYKHFDTHSPFPIHGMDDAMGLGNSIVGWICLGGGIAGLSLGTWLQWWTGAVDYPLNISGKPFFAVEPSIPVMFEVTILFSALAAVAGMFALNGLPRPYNPLFYSSNFARATDDAFFLHIAATDRRFEADSTRALLSGLGATNIEVIRDRGTSDLEA
jgi:Alternative complex III, ActD subunit